MKEIYQVVIDGRKLESQDLRQLLARAVREKKNLDQRLRAAPSGKSAAHTWNCAGPVSAAYASGVLR